MIEFKARVLVDTQDPQLAYEAIRRAFQHTGLEIRIRDTWLKNNQPLPANIAQRIAFHWQKNRVGIIGDDLSVKFQTNDPAFQTLLDSLVHAVEGEGS